MSYGRSTCAMCGDRLAEPYSGFDLPPVCVQLLEGGDDVDPSTIAGSISIDFCEECTPIARRMIRDYDTSPLPECDADAVRWSSAGVMSALAGDDVDADDLAGGDGVDQAVIDDALITVQTHRDGDAFRLYEHTIDRAYVLLMSLHQLGILVDDPLGGER